jgi:hypothetical protein
MLDKRGVRLAEGWIMLGEQRLPYLDFTAAQKDNGSLKDHH